MKRFKVTYWVQESETVTAYDADDVYTKIPHDAEDVKVEYLGPDEPEYEEDHGEPESQYGNPY